MATAKCQATPKLNNYGKPMRGYLGYRIIKMKKGLGTNGKHCDKTGW
ncbi:MAG: hypothetical protein FWF56_03635 [Firmicutes bacterium]|nr:hypothetical protein [Bacillota bacterium]